MIVDNIKYAVSYNKRFYVRLILFQYYNKWYIRTLNIGGVLSLLLCMGYIFSWNPIGFHSFPYFALFYSILVAVLPIYLIYKTNRDIQKSSIFNQEIQFEINSEKIQIKTPSDEKIILWNQVFKVESHPKAWLVYGTAQSFFYLPKEPLNKEQQSLLTQWVVESSKFVH